MGPTELMNSLSLNSSSDSTTLSVLKLHDDGSNWSDYQSRIERAMGSKGLWRHVLGTTVAPKLFVLLNGIPVLADKKTEATEEQIVLQHSLACTRAWCWAKRSKNKLYKTYPKSFESEYKGVNTSVIGLVLNMKRIAKRKEGNVGD